MNIRLLDKKHIFQTPVVARENKEISVFSSLPLYLFTNSKGFSLNCCWFFLDAPIS